VYARDGLTPVKIHYSNLAENELHEVKKSKKVGKSEMRVLPAAPRSKC